MANKTLYREDVLQMLFADSDSEGEYLPFGNDDRSSNANKFKHPFNIYYFLNITDELIKK